MASTMMLTMMQSRFDQLEDVLSNALAQQSYWKLLMKVEVGKDFYLKCSNLIGSLQSINMYSRQSQIPHASHQTDDWISKSTLYQEVGSQPSMPLDSWFRKGDGILWINGFELYLVSIIGTRSDGHPSRLSQGAPKPLFFLCILLGVYIEIYLKCCLLLGCRRHVLVRLFVKSEKSHCLGGVLGECLDQVAKERWSFIVCPCTGGIGVTQN